MDDKAINILLIEDNPAEAQLIEEILTEARGVHLKLECVDRLSTGLARLVTNDIGLVLLDLNLPDSEGFATFAKVYAEVPGVPIVILSGLADENLAIKTVHEGAQDYVVKGNLDSYSFLHTIRYAIERKRTEEQLRGQALIFENIQDSIVMTDLEGNITNWNPAAERMFGYYKDEVFHKTLGMLVTRFVKGQLRDGRWTGEMNFTRKDGTEGICETTVIPLRDEHKNIMAVFGVSHDITAYKRAEKELQEGEARYRELFDNMSSAVAVYEAIDEGKDFIFKDFNKAGERIEKVNKEKLIGKSILEVFPGVKEFGLFAVLQQVWKTGEAKHHPVTLYKDERIVGWRENYVYKLPSGEVVAVYDDVTKRKQAEDALRKSELQLRFVTDRVTDVIWSMDLEGNFTFVTPSAERMIGYTLEEMLSLNFRHILTPESHAIAMELISQRMKMKKREPVVLEIQQVCKDGSKKWCEVTAIFSTDKDNHPGSIIGVTRDISERKQAEEALREKDETISAFLETSQDWIWSIDLKGSHTYSNPAVENILGYTPDELIGKSSLELMHDEDRQALETKLPHWIKEKRGWQNLVLRWKNKDGRWRWLESNAVPIFDGTGKLIGFRGVDRDISERKQTEEELQRSYEKLRETLMATVNTLASTVEIRDPYTAGHQRRVTILACAIAEEMGLTEEQFDGLRMAGLVHDIGKFSVPVEILNKPGRISETEFNIMKNHSQAGYNILKEIEFPWPVAQIVLQHHERLDGSGYPQGLKNGGIILEAKILAVADVVEAMASHRPYRPALGIDVALEEIAKNRGILYDPEVADICTRLFTEKGFMFE
jgi:PAS domain S-box-containing protein/putative nucleotidyltransferase with HDIG domain